MKHLILIAAALLAFPLTAPAEFDGPSDVGAPRVVYLSWCSQNRVVRAGADGQTILQDDCGENRRCVSRETILGALRVSEASCR